MWTRHPLFPNSVITHRSSVSSQFLAFWEDWLDRSHLSRWQLTKHDEVQITQTVVFALIPFLPGLPFWVFNPPGYPFLPKPPLRVFDLPGVQILFIFIPNFCPNLFFFFLVRRDALFCLDSFILFVQRVNLCEVFFDYIWVHRGRKIFTIHSCQHQGSTGENLLNNIWTFIIRSPLAPVICTGRKDPLQN